MRPTANKVRDLIRDSEQYASALVVSSLFKYRPKKGVSICDWTRFKKDSKDLDYYFQQRFREMKWFETNFSNTRTGPESFCITCGPAASSSSQMDDRMFAQVENRQIVARRFIWGEVLDLQKLS